MSNANPVLHLGYLVPEFPSQTHAFFWREVTALRDLGVRVTLLSTRRPHAGACRHEFCEAARGQTHYVFPPRWGRALKSLARRPAHLLSGVRYLGTLDDSSAFREKLKLLLLFPSAAELADIARTRAIDHIHVHSLANAAHLAALCHRFEGPMFSATLHGDLIVYGTSHRAKVADAAFLACVTQALQRQAREALGLEHDRLPVIRMGIDPRAYQDRTARVARTAGPVRCVTVARLNQAKGHRYALQALRRLVDDGVDVEYTIVGEGEERGRLEELALTLKIADCVKFLGTQSETAVSEILQASDVFLLTSVGVGEAAPVSVMEAMAAGLPVVCSIIGGTPELIQDSVDGFLVPQEAVDQVADRVRRLAKDPDLRLRIGRAARVTALQQFDRRVQAARLVECILEARQARSRRPGSTLPPKTDRPAPGG